MNNALQFIGEVQSSLKSIEDCPLQEKENAPPASIIIFPEYLQGIENIAEGSEMLVFTWLHQADRTVIKCITRRNYGTPMVGVFSTRSPDRPNPIGIHTVKVISVQNGMIRVAALEVLDQTPVIDIKPL
jgi:tRNA-Thr(GGU) m(6)t(6)A37 methyltransferase TsaA